MKHTQGKWRITESTGEYNIISEDNLEIAFLSRTNPLDAEANARLIASAPELLEACKSLLKKLEQAIEQAQS